ncbi:MAG TPA: VOC family protein [Capsulimonadaceae bacterium]|nr:VOC family protein [Capsulimonadaceae bacterium]
MSAKWEYLGIYPIGNSNPQDMPVADIDKAIPFYEQAMRLSVSSRNGTAPRSVTFVRDQITLRLAENGRDPEQESCYMEVSDVDAAYADLKERCADISPISHQNHAGNSYRVFFVKDTDGLCYCIGQKQSI